MQNAHWMESKCGECYGNQHVQTVLLCQIETVRKGVKFFCGFVYVSNSSIERRDLRRELELNKRFADNVLGVYWEVSMSP